MVNCLQNKIHNQSSYLEYPPLNCWNKSLNNLNRLPWSWYWWGCWQSNGKTLIIIMKLNLENHFKDKSSSKNLDFKSQFEDEEMALFKITHPDTSQISQLIKFPFRKRIEYLTKS